MLGSFCCCGNDILSIFYEWYESGSRDLDTGTSFLYEKVGWSCGYQGKYLKWYGDNTQLNAYERVDVDLRKATIDNQWTEDYAYIYLAAGWFIPAGGRGNIRIRVSYRGQEKLLENVTPGQQSRCADTSVGYIRVDRFGNFELNGGGEGNPLP